MPCSLAAWRTARLSWRAMRVAVLAALAYLASRRSAARVRLIVRSDPVTRGQPTQNAPILPLAAADSLGLLADHPEDPVIAWRCRIAASTRSNVSDTTADAVCR